MLVWDGGCVWAAGSEAGAAVDDYDWEARHGGGFAALDPVDGRTVVRGRFDQDLAWGTGGVAVVIVPGLRCAGSAAVARSTSSTAEMAHGSGATAAISDTSLGIAHGAARRRSSRLRLQSGRVSAVDASGAGPCAVQLEAQVRHEALASGAHVIEQTVERSLQGRELISEQRAGGRPAGHDPPPLR